MSRWFYVRDGKREGPVSTEQLRLLEEANTLDSDSLVWRSGMPDWQPYGQAAAGGEQIEGQEACSQCGRPFSTDEMIRFGEQWVCAECKPVYLQRIKEGATVPGLMEFGGFWIRAGARILDGLVLFVVNMILYIPVGLLMPTMTDFSPDQPPPNTFFVITGCLLPLIQLAVAVGYETWFLGRFGATPGKMVCRLKVVKADNSAVSYGRAAGRHFATYLSGMILAIGYIMAAFDEEKRALHDHICTTRVIRV